MRLLSGRRLLPCPRPPVTTAPRPGATDRLGAGHQHPLGPLRPGHLQVHHQRRAGAMVREYKPHNMVLVQNSIYIYYYHTHEEWLDCYSYSYSCVPRQPLTPASHFSHSGVRYHTIPQNKSWFSRTNQWPKAQSKRIANNFFIFNSFVNFCKNIIPLFSTG